MGRDDGAGARGRQDSHREVRAEARVSLRQGKRSLRGRQGGGSRHRGVEEIQRQHDRDGDTRLRSDPSHGVGECERIRHTSRPGARDGGAARHTALVLLVAGYCSGVVRGRFRS